ncbi:thiamine pyrophosphate-dependent enzyme [Amycolatopsis iheyensis]|uniref:thiamine pyrophosphate-dependent enzyme n=1 Tax=Amycolatopsis iheyensis TaxID=2945988 RepID=UPI003557C4A2
MQAAFPGRPVVSVAGDGGFMFAAQELATAVQYGLNLVAVVFDNGYVHLDQERLFEGPRARRAAGQPGLRPAGRDVRRARQGVRRGPAGAGARAVRAGRPIAASRPPVPAPRRRVRRRPRWSASC